VAESWKRSAVIITRLARLNTECTEARLECRGLNAQKLCRTVGAIDASAASQVGILFFQVGSTSTTSRQIQLGMKLIW
jgi:hypothetical protein